MPSLAHPLLRGGSVEIVNRDSGRRAIGCCIVAFIVSTFAFCREAKGDSTVPPSDAAARSQTAADQAYDAYKRGDYSRAVALYLESYRLAPTADALFNIASIFDKKAGDPRLAIEYYRRCAASVDATTELVERATARVASLSAPPAPGPPSSASESRAATPPPGASPSRETVASSAGALRAIGITSGAVGLIGVGLGAALGLVARSKQADAQDAGCGNGVCPSSASAATEHQASNFATASTVSFVAGGALAVGGALLFVLAPSRSKAVDALSVAPMVLPGGAYLSVSGVIF